jgi:hypothetical protein
VSYCGTLEKYRDLLVEFVIVFEKRREWLARLLLLPAHPEFGDAPSPATRTHRGRSETGTLAEGA